MPISCMPVAAVHRNAWLSTLEVTVEMPITWPASLIPVAQLPPPKMPRSCMPPDAVQRNACPGTVLLVLIVEHPTTCPRLLIAFAELLFPPGRVPRSCRPVDALHRKACVRPFCLVT